MKKIAAGVGIVALAIAAQFALVNESGGTTTQSGSAMTMNGNMCAGWTKGGGASVGKPNPGKSDRSTSSSSMDASTEAACAAASSSASSSSSSSAQGVVKTKTKSNQSND